MPSGSVSCAYSACSRQLPHRSSRATIPCSKFGHSFGLEFPCAAQLQRRGTVRCTSQNRHIACHCKGTAESSTRTVSWSSSSSSFSSLPPTYPRISGLNPSPLRFLRTRHAGDGTHVHPRFFLPSRPPSLRPRPNSPLRTHAASSGFSRSALLLCEVVRPQVLVRRLRNISLDPLHSAHKSAAPRLQHS